MPTPQPPASPPAAAGALRVEALPFPEAARHRDAWAALATRALEPNAFLDPDFALLAAQHLAAARPRFALVWDDAAPGGPELVAACPVVARPEPLPALALSWMHDLATLGFPLLDGARAADALGALLRWAGEALPRAGGLLLRAVPTAGPTAALLRAAAARGEVGLAELASWERAALRAGSPAGLDALPAKGAKELRRQRRRLAERGAVRLDSAREGPALRAAMEGFLALEAAGWKGADGGALLAVAGRAAFARAATRLLADRGLCRVDTLLVGGEPAAAAVLLRAGPADFLWKIAHDEALARFSPGVQLVLEVTALQREEGRPFTDSCAVPDHPMIDRLWRDRLALSDLAVSLRPARAGRFRRAVLAERGARRLRAGLKRALHAWRARGRRAAGR